MKSGDMPPKGGAEGNGSEWQSLNEDSEKPIFETSVDGAEGQTEDQAEDNEQLEDWNEELEAAVQEIFEGQDSKYLYAGQIMGYSGGDLTIDDAREYIKNLSNNEKTKVVERFKVVPELYALGFDGMRSAYLEYSNDPEGDFDELSFIRDSNTSVLKKVLEIAQGADSGRSSEVLDKIAELDPEGYDDLRMQLDLDRGSKVYAETLELAKKYLEYLEYRDVIKRTCDRIDANKVLSEGNNLFMFAPVAIFLTEENKKYAEFITNPDDAMASLDRASDSLKELIEYLDANSDDSGDSGGAGSEAGSEDLESKEKEQLIEALTPENRDQMIFIVGQLGLDENASLDEINDALQKKSNSELNDIKSKLEGFKNGSAESAEKEDGQSSEELARREQLLNKLKSGVSSDVFENIVNSGVSTDSLEVIVEKARVVLQSWIDFSTLFNALSASDRKTFFAQNPEARQFYDDTAAGKQVNYAEVILKYDSNALDTWRNAVEAMKNGSSEGNGETGIENQENKEKAELVRDLMPIDKTQISFVVNKLGLTGPDGSLPSLAAIEQALNGMETSALKDLKSQLEEYIKKAEGNGETNISPEQMEKLRKMTFGEWFDAVYGGARSEKWPEDSFFAASIERQREAMARYMDMFDADARLEADRKYMREELIRTDIIKDTIAAYNGDLGLLPKINNGLSLEELGDRISGLSNDELNKLYGAVFLNPKRKGQASAKPAPKPAAKPAAKSAPAPVEAGDTGSEAGNGAQVEPQVEAQVEPSTEAGGSGDDIKQETIMDAKSEVDELMADYAPDKMPKNNEELLSMVGDKQESRIEIRRVGGEEAFAEEAMKHVRVWSKLSDGARRSVLERGTLGLNGDMDALNSVIYLQRIGFLPRTLYGNESSAA